MDTKARILETSLRLFNEEGEDHQAAIDIANALDISPGNLYYHFKGKDAIIKALFDEFEEEIMMILNDSDGRINTIEDLWIFFYIALEEIWDFRFFYKNLGALVDRYPELTQRFRFILKKKRDALGAILLQLKTNDQLDIDDIVLDSLIEQSVYVMTFWIQNAALLDLDTMDPKELIDGTVAQIAAPYTPFLVST